jgi:hypothetical protein
MEENILCTTNCEMTVVRQRTDKKCMYVDELFRDIANNDKFEYMWITQIVLPTIDENDLFIIKIGGSMIFEIPLLLLKKNDYKIPIDVFYNDQFELPLGIPVAALTYHDVTIEILSNNNFEYICTIEYYKVSDKQRQELIGKGHEYNILMYLYENNFKGRQLTISVTPSNQDIHELYIILDKYIKSISIDSKIINVEPIHYDWNIDHSDALNKSLAGALPNELIDEIESYLLNEYYVYIVPFNSEMSGSIIDFGKDCNGSYYTKYCNTLRVMSGMAGLMCSNY